jgi:hypothetical protein
MKKSTVFSFVTIIIALVSLSSCKYDPVTTPTNNYTAKLSFKKDFHANYDVSVVDTADVSGNNGDKILGNTRTSVQEIIVDTGITYKGKDHVTRIVAFMTPNPNDTNYFYQDANGDLYRYNFGFTILNQFPYLVNAIGSPVDVGWVLAAKITANEGTQWAAKSDSVLVQFAGIEVYLTSQGIMMGDTTFTIGTEQIKARHARNTVTAKTAGNEEHGSVVIDSYYSTDINAVVEDFFRHVSLSGALLNQQAQGKLKLMTSHF